MASLNPFKTLVILLLCTNITCYTSLALPISKINPTLRQATISAEPALLPFPPVSSPDPSEALSPDITPLFPTPASGSANPPTESSLPIIPSSPSPPNPDDLATPHPELSFSPTGSMIPESSAFPLNLSVSLNLAMVVLISLAFW